MKHEHKGIKRILSAFKNSFDGFVYALREEEAFRQDLLICAVLFILSFFIPVSGAEYLWLIFSLIFVLFAELVNSAIEACIDRISLDRHELSKAAKDIGSSIVFLSFVNLIACWVFVCWKLL